MLERLPEVIANLVLRTLDYESLGCADSACQAWQALVADPALWHELWRARFPDWKYCTVQHRQLLASVHRPPNCFGHDWVSRPVADTAYVFSGAVTDFVLVVEIEIAGQRVVVEAVQCYPGCFDFCGPFDDEAENEVGPFHIPPCRRQVLDFQQPSLTEVLENGFRTTYEEALGEILGISLAVYHVPSGKATCIESKGCCSAIEREGNCTSVLFELSFPAARLPHDMVQEMTGEWWTRMMEDEQDWDEQRPYPGREGLQGFAAQLWVKIEGEMPTAECPQPTWEFSSFGFELFPELDLCNFHPNFSNLNRSDEFGVCWLSEAVRQCDPTSYICRRLCGIRRRRV